MFGASSQKQKMCIALISAVPFLVAARGRILEEKVLGCVAAADTGTGGALNMLVDGKAKGY